MTRPANHWRPVLKRLTDDSQCRLAANTCSPTLLARPPSPTASSGCVSSFMPASRCTWRRRKEVETASFDDQWGRKAAPLAAHPTARTRSDHFDIGSILIRVNLTGSHSEKYEKIQLIFKMKNCKCHFLIYICASYIRQYLVSECERDKTSTHTNTHESERLSGPATLIGAGWVSQTTRERVREKRQRGFVVKSRWTM